MPVARYFLFVGGVLLALLFVVNVIVPQEDLATSPGFDKSLVRIRSTQKLPERVVYDTNLPTIVPAQVNAVAGATPPVGADTARSRVRDTFAQFVPGEAKNDARVDAKGQPMVAEAKPQTPPPAPKKRRIARAHPPTQWQQPMRMAQPGLFQPFRMAQQQQRGFFGGFGTW